MTATYDPTQLAANTTYQIRFHLGDTDAADWQLQDEEIVYALDTRGSVWGATAMCAEALAAKYSRLTSISADGVSQGLNQRASQYRAIAADMQRKDAIYRATPTLSGVSVSDMRVEIANTDRVPDIFRIGMNDNPPNDGVAPVGSWRQ